MRNRKQYPRNWRELARACKERARWLCERCGVAHGTPRRSIWTGRIWPVYLQAAHVHHDKDNPVPELVAVCPTCHWRYYRKSNQIPAWFIEKLKHRKLIQIAYCL
jgi:hypothetical protein